MGKSAPRITVKQQITQFFISGKKKAKDDNFDVWQTYTPKKSEVKICRQSKAKTRILKCW